MLTSILFGTKITTNPSNHANPTISHGLIGLKTLAHIANLDDNQNPNCIKRRHVIAPPQPSLLFSNENDIAHKNDHDEQNFTYDHDVHDDNFVQVHDDENACWATYGLRKVDKRKRFPPPIPLLARTGNLQCHMPWYLKRIYKDDGSLEIKEIRVKRHEYFRAHRENGRLTLHLVELDDQSPLFSNTTNTMSNSDSQVEEMSAISSLSTCLVDDDDDCNNQKEAIVSDFDDELKIDCSDRNCILSDDSLNLGRISATRLESSTPRGANSMSPISCLVQEKGFGKCFGSEGTSPLHKLGIINGMPMVRGY